MTIPDPVERMESRIENNIDRWDAMQKDDGFRYNCMCCGRGIDYEPISVSPRPDAAAVCYECLSPDMRKAYDEWESRINQRPGAQTTER